MRLTAIAAAITALALPTLADLAVTSPINSTTCTGGQTCSIAWTDNNLNNITLAKQGDCTLALYTGGRSQQTFLQPISFPTPINVDTTRTAQFIVDPSVGQNGAYYFIRFSSQTLKDGANPYLSFSAIFTLDGMTGTFNQTVLNQISSSSTLPTATGGTLTGTLTPGGSRQTVTTSTTRNTVATASHSTSAPKSSNNTNNNNTAAGFVNASPVTYTGVAAFVGAVVGLFF